MRTHRNIGLAVVTGIALLSGHASSHPAGWSDVSYYLRMRDGTRLALSLYWPHAVRPQKPAPVILIQTRYGRAIHFAGRAAGDAQRWRDAGYVVAIVDTRGSTASFGTRDVEIGPDEVRDMDEIAADLAAQPWSNGQIIATGVSYMADTADWITSRKAPAVIAAIPREADFDAYEDLFFPGGVLNQYMLEGWGSYTREIDLGRDGKGQGLDCRARAADCPKLFPVLQPVDADPDYRLVREAMSGRKHWGPDDFAHADFRDDKGLNGYSLFASSPAAALEDIRRERKPVQYWGSWVDGGTAEAALARYRSAPAVPMDVWITSNNHGGSVGADPLRPGVLTPTPSVVEQFETTLDFAARARQGKATGRAIHYYVLGAGIFKATDEWPPRGSKRRFMALGAGHALASFRPSETRRGGKGVDVYKVDFSATTGKATRWTTQFGVPPGYPDRRAEDRKLLVYDTPPLTADIELAGTPVATLVVATQSHDPALFVYLEDVAPDGRVSYLTEGELRAVDRKLAEPGSLPYDEGPAAHSFRRADAMPVIPGQAMTIQIALLPTAARIRAGHSLRVAIAGADSGTFHRYSEGGPELFKVFRGGPHPSGIQISYRAWRPSK